MNVELIKDNIRLKSNQLVKVKEMGNVTELMYSQKSNNMISIRLIDKDHYVDLETGEIKECNHIENRAENTNFLRQTLKNLRDKLNTNITDVKKCRWITLTYAKNMTDTRQLYENFKNFNKRLRYKLGKYEYIATAEPQGRGAWHLHVVMIFPDKAPYIPNDELREIWQQGFVTVKKLDDVDNVGAYLTAYLGDMELDDAIKLGVFKDKEVLQFKEIEVEDGNGQKISKKYIKGARLKLYPPKFNLYRCSRGIKDPVISYMENKNAQKKVNAGTLTFEKTLKIYDNTKNYENIINYRYYNSKRLASQ